MPHDELRSARTHGGSERRRHPRVTVDLPITISLADGEHEAVRETKHAIRHGAHAGA